ncbi:MAG: acetolactate decarboxylase [Inquilinus sp.]|uniref:acetolactate decarboxylase n=1 Tax=Inquilinus sp. TaxID=1932117 RepID=UPI003F371C35
MFRVSTTGALVEGVTAAAVTARTLLEHGDFGLGTFADLDDEMVVVDGCVYRVRGTGAASEAAPGDAAPFAVVTRFEPEVDVPTLPVSSLEVLAACCDGHRLSSNLFYAFRLDGRFSHLQTRAVNRQQAAGRLIDAAKAQSEFEFTDVAGTLVGLWWACHIIERGRDEDRFRQAQAATPAASRHAANASARKRRCVRAVVRWRQTLKLL